MSAPRFIPGKPGGVLLICDHASNAVPDGIDLGIDPALLDKHVAIDIGAGPVTEALAARLGAPAVLATVSRLVIDLHRQPDHPGLMPHISDGHPIPGNDRADRAERIARFHRPYHRALAAALFRQAGIPTGDNEPYSGRALNATLNRHGEANGIASLAIEIRNDLIRDDAGVARWTDILAPILESIRNSLASKAPLAT